jgi:hypothetical protein
MKPQDPVDEPADVKESKVDEPADVKEPEPGIFLTISTTVSLSLSRAHVLLYSSVFAS